MVVKGRSLTKSYTMNETAARLQAVDVSENGIHATFEPNKPEPGTLFAPTGEQVKVKTSMTAKLEAKAAEPISKGLAGLIGIAVAVVVYIITASMNYQGVVSRIGTAEDRLTKVEDAVKVINVLQLTTNTVQNDVKAIRENQMSRDAEWKELIKNVNDLRILTAQKQLQQP